MDLNTTKIVLIDEKGEGWLMPLSEFRVMLGDPARLEKGQKDVSEPEGTTSLPGA